jgi:hypothetical protein
MQFENFLRFQILDAHNASSFSYILERVAPIHLQNYKKAVTIRTIQADYYGCCFDL